MHTPTALLLVALLDDAPPPPTATAPSHATPDARARWLPRITLRLSHRGARIDALSLGRDASSTPLGTTFEVRFEWGASFEP